MARIKDGRIYEGLTKGTYSAADRSYYSVSYENVPDDYDTGLEYLSASGSESYAWRDYCDESDYGIDPYEFETEDEYLEAIESIY